MLGQLRSRHLPSARRCPRCCWSAQGCRQTGLTPSQKTARTPGPSHGRPPSPKPAGTDGGAHRPGRGGRQASSRPQHHPYSRSRLSVQGVPAARPCPEDPEESSRAEKLHQEAQAFRFSATPENKSHNSDNSHGDQVPHRTWHLRHLLETSQPPEGHTALALISQGAKGRQGEVGQWGMRAARACLVQESNSFLTTALCHIRRANNPTVSQFPPGGALEGAHCAYQEWVSVPRKVSCSPRPGDL